MLVWQGKKTIITSEYEILVPCSKHSLLNDHVAR